ncbi:MAG: ATP-binding cassette domain-containing protein [Bacteroidales bacterium]|jgi:putative ABC transport system ATP-binding protein|nr:ATP-binding cassette domain-containing protein [Bacteroidales bacterium]
MINCNSVTISFNKQAIVHDFSCHIKTSEKAILHGNSGSGKSSIIKAIMGFTPYSGEISVNDTIVSPETIHAIRSQIFYLHQNIHFHEETVQHTIESICAFQHNSINCDEHTILKVLHSCFLHKSILLQNISSLSGGERQRIGLCIGILLNKPIWLLDEPFNGLDEDTKTACVQHILEIDASMIIVTHDKSWDSKLFTQIDLNGSR